MTEEQQTLLTEFVELYKKADTLETILIIIVVILFLANIVFTIWSTKKREKRLSEYKATLNQEQLQAIKRYNDLK